MRISDWVSGRQVRALFVASLLSLAGALLGDCLGAAGAGGADGCDRSGGADYG